MARTAATFQTVFWDFARSVGYEPDTAINASGLSAQETSFLLRHFNAAYRAAYDWEDHPWEDTWNEGTLTPDAAGIIAYADVGDAHTFNFYDVDPRTSTDAQWVESNSAADGIYVGTAFATVYGFWRPVAPQFTATDMAAAVIAVLQDPILMLAQAEYWRASGQFATAAQRRKDAQDALAALMQNEFPRLLTQWWKRRKA